MGFQALYSEVSLAGEGREMKESVSRTHKRRIIQYKEAHEGITCSVAGCHKQKNTYHEITITTFVAVRFNLCERHYKQFKQDLDYILRRYPNLMK